ncbi:MAG: ABC transporter permease [Anaerolineales bacterium]|nr:ABC transporter permease [Anaerolineales bacterium]
MNTARLSNWSRTVYFTFIMTLKQNVMDGFIIFTILIQPLVIAALALWMLQEEAASHAIFIVVGSGLTGLWSSLLFISGNSINTERWMGTLELLVGQPTPITTIIFGKNLAHVTQSLASMILSYGLASVLFDISLTIQRPLLFIASLLFTIIAFVSFGLIIAPLFVMNPGLRGWQNAMEFPIYILSGFLFPIALLPGWTTPLSYLLAPYWAAQALHGASSGESSATEIIIHLLILTFFSALYAVISQRLFHAMLHKTRVDATLGMQ